MSVTDNREDILVYETITIASGVQFGTWVSTQGVAEVAISAVYSGGTLSGAGIYLCEANDTVTPTELFAHSLAGDPSGVKVYGTAAPASGFVSVGVNATNGTEVTYSIRVTRYL